MLTGLHPANPDTPIGQFRLLSGDSVGTPVEPATSPATAIYNYWSDEEIAAFLAKGAGSTARGIGYAYLALAVQSALTESRSIKTDDLAVGESKRSVNLRAIARDWFEIADGEDAVAADAFGIVPFAGRPRPRAIC